MVRPMAKDRTSQLYKQHRAYPRNPEPPRRHDPAVNNSRHYEQGQRHGDHTSAPQFVEDGRAANYTNDASGWVRGSRSGEPTCNNEDATRVEKFDKSNAWRSESKGNTFGRETIKDYRDADHLNHHSEFRLHHNAGMTHAPEAHDFSKRHIPSHERRGEYGVHRSDALRRPREED